MAYRVQVHASASITPAITKNSAAIIQLPAILDASKRAVRQELEQLEVRCEEVAD